MAGRKAKPEVNRSEWHARRVEAARTPREKLWAYCHWLVAEAWHAGPDHLEDTTVLIRNRINQLIEARKEATKR